MKNEIQKKMQRNFSLIAVIAILLLIIPITGYPVTAATTSSPVTKIVVDMAGRTVEIPAEFNRIACLYPGCTFLVYCYAPDKLVNIDTVTTMMVNNKMNPYPQSDMDRLLSLTPTGTYFKGYNAEQILSTNPDIILTSNKDPNADKEQEELGVPVICLAGSSVFDYPATFKWTGKFLGDEEAGNEMAEIWNNTLDKVTIETEKIPKEDKVKVYYASHDGPLSTVGTKSVMASIIRMAGGRSFMDEIPPVPNDLSAEHQITSIEEIVKWNPDVIVTKTLDEKNQILSDPQWQSIKAVRDGEVYPCLKYERMDGYQSALSVEWLANTLYPDKFHFDLPNDVKSFYRKFFSYDISDEEIAMPFTA
jgi:iron complex transport system substrate-binding protein